ncbi:hypothetical protein [Nocardioides sp.]|uniref:hypothetical protein n=1 Tax=Nocardioides sp. TaxID=35761 RepID=UPI002B2655A3|nr:hypothetical protein [Nocardioides sp.]
MVLDGYSSMVSGYGSRSLVEQVTGRAPAYSTIRRGHVVQESTARDVIAAAEANGFEVVLTGPGLEAADPGRGRW